MIPDSPTVLAEALASTGYLADDGLATAGFLALKLGRPLFLEGEAGVGKTAFAQALAVATGARFVRLQCYEGLDAAQALYDWDFPRQILHLRAAEAAAARVRPRALPGREEAGRRAESPRRRRFLLIRI
ncbi:MoxR family ATPase, partial [Asanoa sp. NPDC050611]|uniref:AAA family ATPase n=1 Tax=Asanoa sp. NPDC050611 TaxID=3157098 RepID=UPI0034029C82